MSRALSSNHTSIFSFQIEIYDKFEACTIYVTALLIELKNKAMFALQSYVCLTKLCLPYKAMFALQSYVCLAKLCFPYKAIFDLLKFDRILKILAISLNAARLSYCKAEMYFIGS